MTKWCLLMACALAGAAPELNAAENLQVKKDPGAVVVRSADGQVLLRYQTERPFTQPASVDGACYFHPLATPHGVVLTDVAPPDHPHHRGIFLGWVEMHGRKDADFWGWGEHAPVRGRRVVCKEVSGVWSRARSAGFRLRNEWQADDDVLLTEDLRVEFRVEGPAHVLDLVYRLEADEDMGLSRWAFGGFCARARKDGTAEFWSPVGVVNFPNPVHTKPESDWPDAGWYDLNLHLPDGVEAGLAVIGHPRNPPTLWHNHRDLRILNPAITAPAPVVMPRGKALTLRYRVVAHDGPVPRELLDRLTLEWSKK